MADTADDIAPWALEAARMLTREGTGAIGLIIVRVAGIAGDDYSLTYGTAAAVMDQDAVNAVALELLNGRAQRFQ